MWKEADVKIKRLEGALLSAFKIISLIYERIHGREYGPNRDILGYDGSDAKRIAEHADKCDLLAS